MAWKERECAAPRWWAGGGSSVNHLLCAYHYPIRTAESVGVCTRFTTEGILTSLAPNYFPTELNDRSRYGFIRGGARWTVDERSTSAVPPAGE